MYEYTVANLACCWLLLLVFIVIFAVVSIIALKLVDRDSR